MVMNRNKTQIYGTLGPACGEEGLLSEMFALGMTGMRLNLSHGCLKEHEAWIRKMQQAARKAGVEAELLIDLQGPELRVGNISVELTEGSHVFLGEGGIPVPEVILPFLEPGQQLLLDDGKLLLQVTGDSGGQGQSRVCPGKVGCRVLRGGHLHPRKSIALPGTEIPRPALTAMDRENIRCAAGYGVTGVMQPFVRSPEDLLELREALKEAGGEQIRILAKLENRQGVGQLSELLAWADEIVIARGDLGNDMPLWELPAVQYEIGRQCRKAKKPYMVVTQMLASMQHAAVPTRAEVSDIFYAVLHGASSVMVTGETAAGEYPVEVMRYLCETVRQAERVRDRD